MMRKKSTVFILIAVVLAGSLFFLIAENQHKSNERRETFDLKDDSVGGSVDLVQNEVNKDITVTAQAPKKNSVQEFSICMEKSGTCLARIFTLLNSEDKVDILIGLNHLWLQVSGYTDNSDIRDRLASLRDMGDYHISEMAKFISMKMGHWPEADSTEGLAFNVANHEQARQLTAADTEASMADNLQSVEHKRKDSKRVMQSQDIEGKIEVVEGVVAGREDDSLELLARALGDENSDVRLAAVDGLGQFLDEGFGNADEIVNYLQQHLNDQDAQVVELSKKLLNRYEKIKPQPMEEIDPQL